jgi:hypothetical protein
VYLICGSLFMWGEAILTWVISGEASFITLPNSQKKRTSQGPILAPLGFGSSIGCLVLDCPAFKEPFLAPERSPPRVAFLALNCQAKYSYLLRSHFWHPAKLYRGYAHHVIWRPRQMARQVVVRRIVARQVNILTCRL